MNIISESRSKIGKRIQLAKLMLVNPKFVIFLLYCFSNIELFSVAPCSVISLILCLMFVPAPCFLFFTAFLIAIALPTIVKVISFSFYRFKFLSFSDYLRESNTEKIHEPTQKKTINSENFCYY